MRNSLTLVLSVSALACFIGCGGGDSDDSVAMNNSQPASTASENYDSGPMGDGTSEDPYAEYGGDEMEEDPYAEYGGGEMEEDPYAEYGDDMEEDPYAEYGDNMEEDPYAEYGDDMEGDPYAEYGGAEMEEDPYAEYGDDMEGDPYAEYGGDDMEGDPYAEYGSGDPYGEGDPYGGGNRNRGPLTLADKAQQSFRRGADRDAFQYLYAHAVVADQADATELLNKIVLSNTLHRPTLGVRWGLGMEVSPPNFTHNPFPIGTKQRLPTRGRPVRNGAGGGYDEASGAGYDDAGGAGYEDYDDGGYGSRQQRGPKMDPILKKGAGELAEKVVEGLNTRIARGDYGKVLQSLVSAEKPSAPGGGEFGGGEFGGGEFDSGAAYEGGASYDSGDPYGDDSYGDANAPGANAEKQIMPGVVYLGIAKEKDLVEKARAAEVNALIVFSLDIGMNPRNGLVTNNTTIQLINAETGKKMASTKALNNITIQKDREDEKKADRPDAVDREIERLFQEIDLQWRVAEMPAMSPESVKSRIGVLLNPIPSNPLPALAEIRMYHARRWLDDQLFVLAYQRMVSEPLGTVLANGGEDEKKQVINQWLPGGQAEASADPPE